jgi:hypothetical protein
MAKEAVPYPDLPETPANDPTVTRAMFWRAAWLRDLAQLEALQALMDRERRRKRVDLVTRDALSSAYVGIDKERRNSFRTLIEAGGLLFAWAPDEKGAAR